MMVVAVFGVFALSCDATQACDVVLSGVCSTASVVRVRSQAVPVVVQSFVPVQQQVVIQQHAIAVQAFTAPVVVQQQCVHGCGVARVQRIQRVRPQRVRSFSLQRTVVR